MAQTAFWRGLDKDWNPLGRVWTGTGASGGPEGPKREEWPESHMDDVLRRSFVSSDLRLIGAPPTAASHDALTGPPPRPVAINLGKGEKRSRPLSICVCRGGGGKGKGESPAGQGDSIVHAPGPAPHGFRTLQGLAPSSPLRGPEPRRRSVTRNRRGTCSVRPLAPKADIRPARAGRGTERARIRTRRAQDEGKPAS